MPEDHHEWEEEERVMSLDRARLGLWEEIWHLPHPAHDDLQAAQHLGRTTRIRRGGRVRCLWIDQA